MIKIKKLKIISDKIRENIILRRFLLIISDYLFISFAIFIDIFNHKKDLFFNVSLFDFIFSDSYASFLILYLPFIFVVVYYFSGIYKGLTKYIGSRCFYNIVIKNIIIIFALRLVLEKTGISYLTNYFWISLLFLVSVFVTTYRLILRDFLLYPRISQKDKLINVIIYGAGQLGAELADSLIKERKYRVISFFDDSPKLWGRTLNGISIKKPKIDANLRNVADQILIAMPSISASKKVSIFKEINSYSIPVYQIPKSKDLSLGKSLIYDLRPIKIEDLLARDFVAPKQDLLGIGVTGVSVIVIGAGGSIGSELCKQILSLKPRNIILFDISESALYNLNNLLKKENINNIDLIPIIGNACNYLYLKEIVNSYKITTIFHAAAYKHVPLVELNPLEGIYNNVFSTLTICKVAFDSESIKQMIFISTDKAVRPTNVMGASKRLGELIVQGYARKIIDSNNSVSAKRKTFSMVRFGNVLGSSGSVVPLFKQQIASGGPLTITHPEVVRYFMTIEEAAQLVLQSVGLAKGGEVFLLDMGKPVKIKDLAEQMILLSGLSLKNKRNINGDLELKFTGLRPGEKLFEELLISEKSESTSHPLIFKAIESSKDINTLTLEINKLEIYIKNNDLSNTLKKLKEIVPEWQKK